MPYVYLLCDEDKNGVYKIGATRGSVENRIKSLQTGNSGNICLISKHETKHPFLIETMLHNKYSNKRVLNEWFELNEQDVSGFINECKKLEVILESLKDNYFFNKKLI